MKLQAFRPDNTEMRMISTNPIRFAAMSALVSAALGLSPAEAAVLTDPAPLDDDAWFALYGCPVTRPTIRGATNADAAVVTIEGLDPQGNQVHERQQPRHKGRWRAEHHDDVVGRGVPIQCEQPADVDELQVRGIDDHGAAGGGDPDPL